ncbi:MAG: 30S ribosomal protein S7 [Planctomycetota bacterium]
MKKKRTASEKTLKPDVRFGDKIVSKFINCVMLEGKKSTAERVFYDAIDIIAKKIKKPEPIEVFRTAIENVKPEIQVRSRRVGGQTYQVPMAVTAKRRQSLAVKWIVQAARSKKGKPMAVKLANEIVAAFNKEGDAITKRENVHKMAEANRLFAHFAW